MCHAKLVEDALAAGRVAIAVACNTLVDVVIVYLSIKESFDPGFKAEFVVVDYSKDGSIMFEGSEGNPTFAAWSDEFGQANA